MIKEREVSLVTRRVHDTAKEDSDDESNDEGCSKCRTIITLLCLVTVLVLLLNELGADCYENSPNYYEKDEEENQKSNPALTLNR